MTSRGDAFRTPTSRQHHSTAGAAVRVRVAPAAAGTPGRRRRRTDARPGALTAGGETAMVRTAERLQSARLGSRLSTEAPDRGPDPRHRRRRACPDPPGKHEIPRSTHAGRLSITQSFYGTCSRMRAGHGHSHDGQPGRAAERDR